jgi:SnoaL-like domain
MTSDAVDAICRLKYAYFRLLDTKQFAELGELFTVDATTAYEAGLYSQTGRMEIVEFLVSSLADAGIVHVHNGHHPEIHVNDDGTATGTWYLEDKVIIPAADLVLGGTALYDDSYRLVGDEWKICSTGYRRIYEERRKHSTGELLSFRSRFQPESPG